MTTPLTRADLKEINDRFAEFAGQLAEVKELVAKQRADIAEDTRAANKVLLEDAFKRFRVIDDQYKDLPSRVRTLEGLPDRVQKLEDAVFPPPRVRRKRSG